MNCDQVRENLEEYALDLLDEQTKQVVTRHLADCPDCQALLDEYQASLATLPELLARRTTHRLPATVKTALFAQLDAQPKPASSLADTSVAEAPTNTVKPSPLQRNQNPARPWLERLFTPQRLRLVLAFASLLLLALVAWGISLNVALARERALRKEFVDLVGHQQELVLEVVDSRETTRRLLLPPSEGSNAYGKVFTRKGMAHVVAMAARLPQPPAGQAYHLWLLQGEIVTLAGVYSVNPQGFALLIYDAPTPDPIIDAAQVTLQPTGLETPVNPPVLVWSAQQN